MGQKHQARLESLEGKEVRVFYRSCSSDASILLAAMIDKWSLGHMFLLVAVGVTQLLVLKKLFDAKPTSHKLSARA